uniref:Uncharacterized protein n=1 Tax=uncultured bacterium scaffold00056 TaxID=1132475 RepID=I7AI43_9BACT|nr:hypothetical protein [uncultured bacterium scaffold00056]
MNPALLALKAPFYAALAARPFGPLRGRTRRASRPQRHAETIAKSGACSRKKELALFPPDAPVDFFTVTSPGKGGT